MGFVRDEVLALIFEVRHERFDDAEEILRGKIDIAKEALWRVQMAQRPPGVVGLGCGLLHPDGFAGTPVIDWVGEDSVEEVKERLLEIFKLDPSRLMSAAGVAQAVGITTKDADALLDDLESEGLVESIEFPHAIQRRRYRLVVE
jgi:hypothetical protein